ncbi:hypothetical protein L227DRAFT_581683 [Lentinus tigrinus ALCF2SS1-6]|uniref:Uncharacterized protein n=1 Tax=Lentinus tigrinus ALCF2SS1-6 TaxID=1328759 RepID=A0A5C2RN14_9APHY|nr:hypothetical protein L227DRAFT_581683 [Lentinus tigrinus ALCF2SS1-6]
MVEPGIYGIRVEIKLASYKVTLRSIRVIIPTQIIFKEGILEVVHSIRFLLGAGGNTFRWDIAPIRLASALEPFIYVLRSAPCLFLKKKPLLMGRHLALGLIEPAKDLLGGVGDCSPIYYHSIVTCPAQTGGPTCATRRPYPVAFSR